MRRVLSTIGLSSLISFGAVAPGVAAEAPRRTEMARVRELARDLESATRRIDHRLDAARRQQPSPERETVDRVEVLARRARDFRREVERQQGKPERTVGEFESLAVAYRRVGSLGLDHRPRRDWDAGRDLVAVDRLMAGLSAFYGEWNRDGERVRGAIVPSGSEVVARIEHRLRSRDLRRGSAVEATLAEDLAVAGRTLVPRGAPLTLRVVEVVEAGRDRGRETLVLELTGIEVDGRAYGTESERIALVAESSTDRDAGTIVGTTLGGAFIGALMDGGDGAIKGAAVGAGAGAGVVLATRGRSVDLKPGERLHFRLAESLRLGGWAGERDQDRDHDRDRDYDPGPQSRR